MAYFLKTIAQKITVALIMASSPFVQADPAQGQWVQQSFAASPVVASEDEALTGEAALQQLKQDGSYNSLAEAMTAARYGMREVEGSPKEAWAQNPQQSLNSRFDETGLRLVVKAGPEERYPSRWELKSVAGEAVPSGTLQRAGQTLELERAELGLTEWYVNRPSGLEHGFTLENRPEAAGGLLELTLSVTGRLGVRAEEDGQSLVVFQKENDRTLLNYGGLKVWDAEGKDIAAYMETNSEGNEVRYIVEDAEASYPLTIDPTFILPSQQAYLKASNSDADDMFGISVAISGDTIVVGANGEDSNASGSNGSQEDDSASNAGAAYVFVRNGSTWSQQAYLKASNPDAFDDFGESVAISEDTIIIGAPGEASNADEVNGDQEDNLAFGAGAVYVFIRNGSIWSQQAYLKASNSDVFDCFGQSVAISGDTILVGAEDEDSASDDIDGDQTDNSAFNAGAAYVFVRNGNTWSQQAYLKAFNSDSTDTFGNSVAISGDTIVVGAIAEDSDADEVNGDQTDNSARNAGAAYVFIRNGNTWAQQAYLKASNSDGITGNRPCGDSFGQSVAISGDTIVIGAGDEASDAEDINGDQNDNSEDQAGAAYVFVRNGSIWSQQAYLKASNSDDGDNFGRSVGISGNIIVVSADGEDSNSNSINRIQGGFLDGTSGAAYVFMRNESTWSQQAYLKASNSDGGENGVLGDVFGGSMAISGNTIVIGASREDSDANGINGDQNDNSAELAGAAYVFVLDERVPSVLASQQSYLKASNAEERDVFGRSVAVSSDTVVIGAPGEDSLANMINGDQTDNSASGTGAAYVFIRNGDMWSQQAYLKPSSSDIGDGFGNSVAISADTIVVGALGEDSSANGVNGNQSDNSLSAAGAAYVFIRNGSSWSQQAYLKASNPGQADNFGGSVAVSEDTIVVAASGEASDANGVNGNQADNSLSAAGAVYVFVRSGSAWSQQAYLKASNTGQTDRFGESLAISGDTIVVGAPDEDSDADGVNGDQEDSSAFNAGAAYVFFRNGSSWSQQAYLKASNSDSTDAFGGSVAISGDTIVVGAADEDGDGSDQADNEARSVGAAYVFIRNGINWSQQAYLKASNADGFDEFGNSVAISGDTIAVSAFNEQSDTDEINGNQFDESVSDAGAVYVFVRSANIWSQQAYLKASNSDANDEFGISVAISEDTIVVGAQEESSNANEINGDQTDNSAEEAGAAYVFIIDENPALLNNAYDDWIAGFFPNETNPDVIAPSADPNGDGIPNVIAFILNGSPLNFADNDLPQPMSTPTDFAITFPRRDDAADLFDPFIEFGTDLMFWNRAVNGQGGVTITVDDDFFGLGVDRVTISIERSAANGTDEKTFGRLRVD